MKSNLLNLKKILPNKRGQTGGLITGLVMGVAALVIGVIIALVITSTLANSNLLTAGTDEAGTVGNLTANFTDGINNVSSKIPTVLLIAAIVLILGVMVFLVVQWQRMRLGGGGGSVSL